MHISTRQLWFDVESKYEATYQIPEEQKVGCGLMQNQNMKQQADHANTADEGCGLMQNQNMKQLKQSRSTFKVSCGLMQNQNMKRVELKLKETTAPVAWWVPLKK